MRWQARPLPKIPRHGDTRIIGKFLWTPYTIKNSSGERETRWLECAKIEQVYSSTIFGGNYWKDERWID